MDKTRRVRTLSFLQGTTLNLLKQSILFILLWLIFRDKLTTSELISMQFISTAIFGPLQDMGTIILHYREVEASINNFDTLMTKTHARGPVSPKQPAPLRPSRFEEDGFRN